MAGGDLAINPLGLVEDLSRLRDLLGGQHVGDAE